MNIFKKFYNFFTTNGYVKKQDADSIVNIDFSEQRKEKFIAEVEKLMAEAGKVNYSEEFINCYNT